MKRKEKNVENLATPNQAQPQKKKKKNNGTGIIIGLALSVFIFAALLFIQVQVAGEDEEYYKVVYIVKEEMPEGTKLTEENLNTFIGTKRVDTRNVPAAYIEDVADIEERNDFLGKYTNRNYEANDVLTMDGLDEYSYTEGIKDPVQVSFSVGGIDQIVAGTVREGDLIDIYTVRSNDDPLAEDLFLIEDMYLNKRVLNSFTSSGEYVNSSTVEDGEKDDTPVQLITIIIDKSEEEEFFKRLEDSNFRVAKVVK